MKNSMLLMLLPVTLAMAVIGVFFVLFPERFMGDMTFIVSILFVAVAAGVLLYSMISGYGKTGAAGLIGSIGIGTVMSVLVFLMASGAAALAITGIKKGAMALDIVTLAGFVATFVIVRATGSTGFRKASKPDTRSSQLVWADRLETIGRGCGMYQLKTRLLKLAGETRFLAQDEGRVAAEVNLRISSVLDTVDEAVRRGDEQGATIQMKRLRNLFAEREIELMNMRGRA
jgi:hypothetical protein